MKLSVEAKVAASVAAGFVALSVGVIAQQNGGEQSAAPDGYSPTNYQEVGTQMSQYAYDSSLTGRTKIEENKQRTQ